jgi:hypothetical protein
LTRPAQVQADNPQAQNCAKFGTPLGGLHMAGMERVRTLHRPGPRHGVGDGNVGVYHARRIAESGNVTLRSKGFASGSQLYPQKG